MPNESNITETKDGLVEKSTGRKIESPLDTMAVIEPFEIQDVATGIKIKLTVSPQYSVLSIDDRSYYFYRENGKFDGTSKDLTFSEVV